MNVRVSLCTRKTVENERQSRTLFIRAEQQRRAARCGRTVRRRFLRTTQRRRKQQTRFRLDLVNRAVRERYDKQVSVWSGLNVGGHAEILTDHEALAFGLVKLVAIVGNAIRKPRIGKQKMLPVGG